MLWDCFPDSRRPGGAPANVVYHARLLGAEAHIASRVGCDELGDEIVAYLEQRGIGTDLIQRDAHHPTGRVTVDLTSPERPRYTIHEDVAWDHLEYTPGLAAEAARADAICFGTLAQRGEVSRATIRRVLEAGSRALRVYDVNLRPPWYQREWIEGSLARCEVVKLNEEEARDLSEMFGLAKGGESFARGLLERFAGVRLVCVTRAERGCLLVTREAVADDPGERVAVADAVGAGDAFTAALIVAWLGGLELPAVARFASRVGAAVAARPGAMPEVRDVYDRLRRETFRGGG